MKKKTLRIKGLIKRLETVMNKHGNLPVGVLSPEALENGTYEREDFVGLCHETNEKGQTTGITLMDRETALGLDPL